MHEPEFVRMLVWIIWFLWVDSKAILSISNDMFRCPLLSQIIRSKITTEAEKTPKNEWKFKQSAKNGNADIYRMKSATTIYQMCLWSIEFAQPPKQIQSIRIVSFGYWQHSGGFTRLHIRNKENFKDAGFISTVSK